MLESVDDLSTRGGSVSWSVVDRNGVVLDSGEQKNIVTRDSSILLAILMKNTGTVAPYSPTNRPASNGVKYLAYGDGNTSWGDNPPPADANVRKLVNYIGRVGIDVGGTDFLDVNNNVVMWPTPKIRMKFTIIPSQSVTIREMGLIGGNASSSLNPIGPGPEGATNNLSDRDILINYVTLKPIAVPNGSVLNWSWTLTF